MIDDGRLTSIPKIRLRRANTMTLDAKQFIRLTVKDKKTLDRIAKSLTRELGFKVTASAVARQFVLDGIERHK